MAKKPWTDPFPNLPRGGIARQFAESYPGKLKAAPMADEATEERKPPGPERSPAPQGDTVKARRAASTTGSRPRDAAPTVDDAPELTDEEAARAVMQLAGKPVVKRKGHGRVVLPAPPALGKSTISSGMAKALKSKGGRPRTIADAKPWAKAGMSKATWYRKQGRSG